ncbi:pre-toxin TG domain-containing protein [Bacillus pseudomycoides]|nr:pre-toxin TG domain-containing protein [Bacillus pseudomycoides]MED4651212.1 pre-toxin TG domain-containing protein [Bacillus pseudomycoides]
MQADEFIDVNDAIRAVTGTDQRTGKELSTKERLIAASWTLLNIIPVRKVLSVVGKAIKYGGKMAEGVDYVTATIKGVEVAEDGTVIGKQVGPGKLAEWVHARHAESSKKINDEIQGIEGIEASLAKGTGDTKFTYKNNPMDNPKAIKDILENPDEVYGFSPNPDSTRIGKYTNKIDWSDFDQVEIAKQTRQAYHEANEQMLNNP